MNTFSYPKNIFLTGMPGSGKSTLGKQLAAFLKVEFYDLDHYIEEYAEKDINRIFSEDGEAGFRSIEKKCLTSLIELPHSKVVATGGGTPCFHGNIDQMNQSGATIFLQVPLEVIVQRLTQQGTDERPLLKDKTAKELLGQLHEHFAQRKNYYLKAQIHLEGSAISLEQVIDALEIL